MTKEELIEAKGNCAGIFLAWLVVIICLAYQVPSRWLAIGLLIGEIMTFVIYGRIKKQDADD